MKKLLLLIVCFLPLFAEAEVEYFGGGVNYTEITPVTPVTNTGKIEVVEVFWYACPHCFAFEPSVHKWLESKPDDVEYVRVPGVLSSRWVLLAKAYYAAQELGVEQKMTPIIFNHIHVLNNHLDKQEDVEVLFEANGVAKVDFQKAFRSFSVNTKIGQAKSLNREYGITGVPAIIVDGRYRIDTGSVGSFEKVIDITNFLLKKVRDERSNRK